MLKVYDRNIVTSKYALAELIQPVRKADEADFSIIGKLQQKVMSGMSGSDPEREQIVAGLEHQINLGIYEVDGDQVAEKMLQRAIIDEIA